MKIGNTDYNVKAIKEMGFKEFDKLYKNRITDTKEVYEKVTGEKVEEKEKKEEPTKLEFEVTKKPTIVKDKK